MQVKKQQLGLVMEQQTGSKLGRSTTWLSEKAMATHSSVLAWRIPGTGEPGGLPSIGSHRVGHDLSDLAAAAAAVMVTQH